MTSKIITLMEYQEYLKTEGVSDKLYIPESETEFGTLEELVEQAVSQDFEVPSEYDLCEDKPFKLDAQRVVEDGLEWGEHYEDAIERVSEEQFTMLQTFLDAWCKNTGIVSYTVVYPKITLKLTKEEVEKLRKEELINRGENPEEETKS